MSEVAPTAHSELGASISARWMACPGSVNLSRGKDNIQTEHAKMGQVAHVVGARSLLEKVDPSWFVDEVIDEIVVDEEMTDAVQVYTDHCRMLMLNATDYGIEEQFSLAELNPPSDMFGTTDFWAYHANAMYEGEMFNFLDVVDYKNGSGVVVEAKGNPQLRYYALGAALKLGAKYPIDKVRMTIVQPRAQHPDGIVRSEVIDYLDLLAFAGELLAAARKTLPPDAPLNPGSHCRFCPASASCPAQREQVQLMAQVAFEAMPVDAPPVPAELPPDVFDDILQKLPILEDWARAMRAEAFRRLEKGEHVEGFKLVPKRPKRVWVDEEQVREWLRDEKKLLAEEIYNQKLKSPAQIEKVLHSKKAIPAEFVEKVSSGYTLAPLSDARPALSLSPGDVFQALPPGDE